jgi:hypothetical protein
LVGFPLLSGLWNWYFGASIEVIKTIFARKSIFRRSLTRILLGYKYAKQVYKPFHARVFSANRVQKDIFSNIAVGGGKKAFLFKSRISSELNVTLSKNSELKVLFTAIKSLLLHPQQRISSVEEWQVIKGLG